MSSEQEHRRKHKKIQSIINSTHYFMCTGFPFAFTQAPSTKRSSSHRSLTCLNRDGELSSHNTIIWCNSVAVRERGNFMLNNENNFFVVCNIFPLKNFITQCTREIQILFSGTADVRSNTVLLMQMTHNRNLMVFPPSWTVSDAIKLEITLFFRLVQKRQQIVVMFNFVE